MNALEVSQRSIDAWNRHDADALVALYAEGGTYETPHVARALTGQAIGDFAKSVWASYPDGSLEIIHGGDTGGGLVATQLIIHGTHTGPFMDGTPPTSRTSPIRWLSSLRLRAIRSAGSASTLTGRRQLSNWGSKPSTTLG